jgi:hypothetical protein
MTYTVRVDDNFHYMDNEYRYTHGEYETLDDAVKAAREIVDGFLASAYTAGMSPEDLYQSYTSLGGDPFIVGPEDSDFSAGDYDKAGADDRRRYRVHRGGGIRSFLWKRPSSIGSTLRCGM